MSAAADPANYGPAMLDNDRIAIHCSNVSFYPCLVRLINLCGVMLNMAGWKEVCGNLCLLYSIV